MTSKILRFHEGSISLPEGFQDRTVNILIYGDPDRSPLNLNLSRDNLDPDETITTYVDRQVALMKKKLSGHHIVSRQKVVLGHGEQALNGEQIEATHKSGKRTLYQRQAAFVIKETRVLVCSVTSVKPFDETLDACWQNWLSSYKPHE